jgi:Zn finger protein HypA/HybF involved in hydrogenase expression
VHDYHAVEALVERLASELGDSRAGSVAEVRIRASAVFAPEALQQAYEILIPGTPLERSRLVVEELPGEYTCSACGKSSPVSRDDLAGHMLVCPHCGALSAIDDHAAIELLAVVGIEPEPGNGADTDA